MSWRVDTAGLPNDLRSAAFCSGYLSYFLHSFLIPTLACRYASGCSTGVCRRRYDARGNLRRSESAWLFKVFEMPAVEQEPTSSSLIRAILARDPQAWSRFAQLYGPVVYRWVRQWGLQENDAADVVQEVFQGE